MFVFSISKITQPFGQIAILEAPEKNISSTEVRATIAELTMCDSPMQDSCGDSSELHRALSSWLAPKVLNYILENKVYK